jgi:hypothetical protein
MKHILNILFVLCTANSLAQSVGIGTTTPYAKLEISHSSASRPSIAIKDSSTSLAGWLQFGQVNSFRNMNLYGYASTDGSSASQRLYIGSDSIAAALTIKGDGNIGIGSVAPNSKLEIVHNSSSRPSLAVTDLSPIYGGWIQMGRQGSTKNMNIFGFSPTDGSSASQRLDIGSDSIAAALTIKGNGNIGIGSVAPNSKLEIVHNSGSRPSLAVTDLSPAFAGWVQMSKQGSNRNMNIYGFPSTDGSSASQRMDFGSDSASSILTLKGNGNVGINKSTPTERLDINGNINIANGTLKANGTAGLPGQYLGINNSNQLQWMDKSDYKNFIVFNSPVTNASWNIPVGTTKILVELWGGGGGSVALGGGGGGGYLSALLNVTGLASLTYSVGNGGAGGITAISSTTAATGGSSSISLPAINLTALGGEGASLLISPSSTGPGCFPGNGGNYSISPTGLINAIGKTGNSGQGKQVQVMEAGTNTFYEISSGGNGGDAANAPNTGGIGVNVIIRLSDAVPISYIYDTHPSIPGGGGGAGYRPSFVPVFANTSGFNGAGGMVIIHY